MNFSMENRLQCEYILNIFRIRNFLENLSPLPYDLLKAFTSRERKLQELGVVLECY